MRIRFHGAGCRRAVGRYRRPAQVEPRQPEGRREFREGLHPIHDGHWRAGPRYRWLRAAQRDPLGYLQRRFLSRYPRTIDFRTRPIGHLRPLGSAGFRLETLEGSKDPWSALYDFNGRHGLPVTGSRVRSSYTRDLTGRGVPDIIIGQYSGGSHCCTVAIILELGRDAVTPIGRIDGIDGLPFEGLDVRKLTKAGNWQCIAHRSYATTCGTHSDAANVPAVYAFTGERFQDQTVNFGDYLQDVLRQDLGKWRQEKNRNVELLQTLAVDYAVVGQKDEGKRFFALNLSQLMPSLQNNNVDPNACLEGLESLVDRVPVAGP